MKHTLVIGASENVERYSNKAVKSLRNHNHTVAAIGIKEGNIDDVKIITEQPTLENIHTVSLYVNPILQKQYYDYILSLNPKRVIFNPGTENPEFKERLTQHNIEALEACTLVLLSIGNF